VRPEPDVSRMLVEESLRLWRELGDKWWMAVALEHVGFMLMGENDYRTAQTRLEEGVSLARKVTDRWPLALCLVRLSSSYRFMDVAAAHRTRAEALAVARSVGDKSVLCQGLTAAVGTYLIQGDLAAAAAVAEEARVEARAIGSVTHIYLSLLESVITACRQGDPTKARGYCLELLALARETGAPTVCMIAVFASGIVASFSDQPQRAVRLLAALESFTSSHFSNTLMTLLVMSDRPLEKTRAQLDPATFEAAWAEGEQLTLEQAMALATEDESKDASPPETGR
jgi:hypothetical protein